MHTNSTTNYSLPQFLPNDKPAWLTDVNPAYLTIDNGMKANADAATAAQTDATQALADAAGANAIATQADAKASGAVASLSELFLDTNTYAVGEYVIFNNILYVCIEPVTTPGPWTGSVNWERASLDSIATNIKSNISTIESNMFGSNIPMSTTDSTPVATKINNIEGQLQVVGTVSNSAWTATQNTQNQQKLTNNITLNAGSYIISMETPIADATIALAFYNETSGYAIRYAILGSQQSYTFPLVLTAPVEFSMRSAQSNIVHFSYPERGGLAVMKIA